MDEEDRMDGQTLLEYASILLAFAAIILIVLAELLSGDYSEKYDHFKNSKFRLLAYMISIMYFIVSSLILLVY